ncbi:MAG: PAS domain S-box protein, partial [Bacillota bacterium]
MSKIQKLFIVFLILIVLVISFSAVYASLINDFKNTAVSKQDLIDKHVQVSNNIIEGLATYGNLFFEQGCSKEPALYAYLVYDPDINGYALDSARDEAKGKEVGNLTGLGPIPTNGAISDTLKLALKYNEFFRVYHSNFPDIAWLYYTDENDFIFMYPWVSSKDFRYSKDLKEVEFYKGATPANDPQRKNVWTPVYVDAAGKGPMVTLSAPIYQEDTFKGVVSLDLTNAWLSREIKSQYESYLIDDTFTVLAAGKKDLSMESIDKLNKYLKLPQRDLEKIFELKENTVHPFHGYYLYTAGFEDVSWKMIFLIPIWFIIGKSVLLTLPILLVCILFLLATSQAERRRKSEELLARKNDLFETTLYSIDEGIIVTDLSGKITMMNKMAEEYTGWSNEEACGKEFQAVFKNINTITDDLSYNPVSKVLKTGQNISLGKNTTLISKYDSEIYISGGVSAIRSESETITGAVVSFRDITKEYEQEKQIESFIELNFDMLCVMDSKGYYHKVNKKFEEVLGYKSAELEGKSFLTHIHEEDVESTIKGVQNFIQYKQGTSLISRFQCKDGTYKYVEWHA